MTFLRLIAVPLMALVLLKIQPSCRSFCRRTDADSDCFLAIIRHLLLRCTDMSDCGNDSRYASAIIFVTPLASIVTMPLMVMLLQMVL